MKPVLSCLLLICAASFVRAADRPKITGIDHVDFYTTDAAANTTLYTTVLGLEQFPAVEAGQSERYKVGAQWVGYSPAPDPSSTNRMDHVAFRTSDCEALRSYLQANGIKVPGSLTVLKSGEKSFRVTDPEGHAIEFVQPAGGTLKVHVVGRPEALLPISRHMIHVGFVVHDRAAEDHFYKDILGFHLYWQGGMQDDKTDWAAMQVPDGTDWLEYMLNVPTNADHHLVGVMNHFSLGVENMDTTEAALEKTGWKPHGEEHKQLGKDGKMQLNVFDPDEVRVEFMNFKPSEKPCCSDFMGEHPAP